MSILVLEWIRSSLFENIFIMFSDKHNKAEILLIFPYIENGFFKDLLLMIIAALPNNQLKVCKSPIDHII